MAAADDDFEVTIKRPLGIQLADKPDVGVVVAAVGDGSNAKAAGVAVGDVVLATSATMGASMWPKNTVDGVEAAIRTRLDGRVRLRLRRPDATAVARLSRPWELPLIDTFEVELSQPLGMVLREREDDEDGGGGEGSSSGSEAVLTAYGQGVANLGSSSSSSAEDDDDDDLDASSGIVEVAEVAAGGSAAASGRIRASDVVLATSGTLGDKLWEKSTLEGVLAAISTRLALSPTVTLRLSRTTQLGPWASELHAIARGEQGRLSSTALTSLRSQRRELREGGALRGEAVFKTIRHLSGVALLRANSPLTVQLVLNRLLALKIPVDARLATAGMSAALRCDAPDLGVLYFDALTLGGGTADSRAYTSLIKVHAAAGRVAEALSVERRMSAERVPPSERTYNTLMAVCARGGDRKGMLKYFTLMGGIGGSKEGQDRTPTVESWNILLDYCARHVSGPGRVLQAEDVMTRMRKQGCPPDTVSYSCLARAYVAAGEAGKCEELVSRMEEEGVPPDLMFLNTILDGYARQLKWNR